ncbi:MAG: hypothetical protein R3B90_02160 [Planctomycetaceae bacterium]
MSVPQYIVDTVADRQDQPSSGDWLARATGHEATGFLMSFAMHAALLLASLLLVFTELPTGRRVAPIIVTESDRPPTPVLEPLSLELIAPPEADRPDSAVKDFAALNVTEAEIAASEPLTIVRPEGGQADVHGSEVGPADNDWPTEVPRNAVRAGSFLAWWIPEVKRYGERVEPGQLPRQGQKYFIHLQLRMPPGRGDYPLSDLSGEIVGTDGYRQPIPERAYVTGGDGKLKRAPPRLSAESGVVEVVFEVGGAGKSGIRDIITVRSELLGEQQILTLEFVPDEFR